jgi:hypothetical protein
VSGDDLALLDADHDAASGAAEAAGGLRPFDLQRADPAGHRLSRGGQRDPGRAGGDRRRLRLQHVAPAEPRR